MDGDVTMDNALRQYESSSAGTPDAEAEFQRTIRNTDWFREYVAEYGEEPDLDTPDYDYRAAVRAGALPTVRDKTDISPKLGKPRLHWSSQFKTESHPNRYVGGVDTKTGIDTRTGQPVDENALRALMGY